MKEHHQTPRKGLSHRRSKDSPSPTSISDHPKNPLKLTKKSLNAEFSSVSEDFPIDSVTESLDLSPISEVLTISHTGESIDSSEWLIPADSRSSMIIDEVLNPLDSTLSSKMTAVIQEFSDHSTDQRKAFVNNGIIEADLVANHLKQARMHVLSSSDIRPGSKKLLDVLVELSLREFNDFPNDEDKIDMIINNRGRVLVFSFLAWLMICLSMMIFCCGSGTQSSSSLYPPPT